MKLLTFIKSVIKSKSKTDERSIESMFPELKNDEYALIRADRNTGIILTDQFKYATNDYTTVYKKISHLSPAVKTAKEIVAENPTVEIGVYNHNKEIVYHMDIEKEKFHNPHLEFNYRLKQQIDILPTEKLLAFALDICKRLLPEYIKFHESHQWGDPGTLAEAINYCESHKIDEMKKSKLQDYHRLIDTVTPDTEDFGDYDGSYALNACFSIISLLDFLIDGDTESIIEISSYMTDTIDFKLGESNADLVDNEINEHPDMIDERRYQLELLRIRDHEGNHPQ